MCSHFTDTPRWASEISKSGGKRIIRLFSRFVRIWPKIRTCSEKLKGTIKGQTSQRGPHGIFADVDAVRAVSPTTRHVWAANGCVTTRRVHGSRTRHTKSAARARTAAEKCVSAYSFSCFSSGENRSAGHALQVDAARVRRIARVTGKRAHALQ